MEESKNFEEFEKEVGMTALDQDTTHMHEFFTSLSKAGFNEKQALILVALMVDAAERDVDFTVDPSLIESFNFEDDVESEPEEE